MNHDVIIVIATYNEADNIRQVLNGLRDYQVIIVDDNSPDGTGDIAASYENVTVIPRYKKLGLASAYMRGFKAALKRRPQYVIQMDAGLTHDPAVVPHLIASARGMARAGDVLVTGSRFYYPLRLLTVRTVISLVATRAMRHLGVPVRDATCGFRCWPASLLRVILESRDYKTQAQGHAFQMELLYDAWQRRRTMIEVAIEYRLSNSSFRPIELIEALQVYRALWREHRRNR